MVFFNTNISANAKKYVNKVLDSTFISEGEYVEIFEKKLCEKFYFQNLATVNSGTAALHLALMAAGVKKGDEVILSAQTFIASALAILYIGAKPVFADIQLDTGNLCPISAETKITKKTKAIMLVHWAGYPCDIVQFNKLAQSYNLKIIEDAAHALGTKYNGDYIGSHSDFVCFSFQAIKHLTTGDGGGVVSKNKEDYEHIKRLRWFGIDRKKDKINFYGERDYNLNEIGYKYHMNNIDAAIGLGNLENIDSILKRHREIANIYRTELENLNFIKLMKNDDGFESSNWFFQLLSHDRDKLFHKFKNNNLPISIVHERIDRNDLFGGLNKDLKNQSLFTSQQLALPIHSDMTNGDIEKIIKCIKS